MNIIKEGKIDIWSWCVELEADCINQALNVANYLPVFKHVCLMPDAHLGYGLPIGGVVALRGAISPNMVGVDIGCGMGAVKTGLKKISTEQIKRIMKDIRSGIPLGFYKHKKDKSPPTSILPEYDEKMEVVYSQRKVLSSQVGTLGGGNHFIEIQKGSDGHIWFMVHSGSRNLGFKVAKHYNLIAEELDFGKIPQNISLSYLPVDTDVARKYVAEMEYCLKFAALNRSVMKDRIMEFFADATGCDFLEDVDIHHNYASFETHFGEDVVVHRKGATSARSGEIGIIPGSQGTPSYIVSGKGNPDSFMSCSHGAGRRLGRRKAVKTLNLKEEIDNLDKKGIIHSIRSKNNLDEAPSAYKDIDVVMDEQKDLVDIVTRLMPIAVIKE